MIINNGTLTIMDSGNGETNTDGTITGGSNTGSGGGIYNNGTLTLNGGIITGNKSEKWGGGVYLAQGAIMNLYGGTISNNICTNNGGGVHVSERAILNVFGNPVVTGNEKGTVVNNVNLAGNTTGTALILVSGTLSDASIGVSVSSAPAAGSPRVITGGLSGKGTETGFTSDSSACMIGRNEAGEAILGIPVTVSFVSGEEQASGTMNSMPVASGSLYTLPACGYSLDGKNFVGWQVDEDTETKAAGDTITVIADTTLTARWSGEPVFRGHAVLLSGQIGLQFFLELPGEKTSADYPGSYVTFEGNKIDSSTQFPLPENTAKIRGTETGRYLFTVNLSSIQMADPITPTFHYTEDEREMAVTGEAYSVEDYLKWALDAMSGTDLTIVQALADYGYYAQPYLSAQNGWTIGTDYAEMATHVTSAYSYYSVKEASKANAIVKGINDRITKVTYQMQFGSVIALRVYLTPAEGVTLSTVTVDGNTITPTKSGDRYYVTISDIKATQLADPHTITAEGATTTVSPLSYVYSILSSSTTSDDAKNLVCALYNFALACR